MKRDSEGNVVHMEPEEIKLFELYRESIAGQAVRSRDDLPYSPAFDALLERYNRETGQRLDDRAFWHRLKYVLKRGEAKIDRYLGGSVN